MTRALQLTEAVPLGLDAAVTGSCKTQEMPAGIRSATLFSLRLHKKTVAGQTLTGRLLRSRLIAGDQAGPALERQIRPEPIERDGEAVSEADPEVNVRETPHDPRHATGKPDGAEIRDPRRTPHCCHVAQVAGAEAG